MRGKATWIGGIQIILHTCDIKAKVGWLLHIYVFYITEIFLL